MTTTSLDDKAELVTKIQTVLRIARDDRNAVKLAEGAALIDSPAFDQLPPENQEDLLVMYVEAMSAGLVLS